MQLIVGVLGGTRPARDNANAPLSLHRCVLTDVGVDCLLLVNLLSLLGVGRRRLAMVVRHRSHESSSKTVNCRLRVLGSNDGPATFLHRLTAGDSAHLQLFEVRGAAAVDWDEFGAWWTGWILVAHIRDIGCHNVASCTSRAGIDSLLLGSTRFGIVWQTIRLF